MSGDQAILFSGFTDTYLQEVFAGLDSTAKRLLLPPGMKTQIEERFVVGFDLFFDYDVVAVIDRYHRKLENYIDEDLYCSLYPGFIECRYYFDKALDRLLLNPISTAEKEAYFKVLVMSCLDFLARHGFSTIFFHATPHFPADICLFFAAKYIGVDTYITKRTLIDNTIFLTTDFRRDHDEFNLVKPENRCALHLQLCKNSTWLSYSKAVISRVSSYDTKANIFQLIKVSLRRLLGSPLNNWYYDLGRLETLRILLRRFNEIRRNQLAYKRLSTLTPDLDRPFLVFFLHFQPERSTLPEAEYFDNQFELINIVARAIPSGYTLLVKEHPRQDMEITDFRQLGARNPLDYEQLATLHNVVLVDKGFSSTALIKQAALVISCNGSSIWEGLMYSVPGLSFARTWHADCAASPCYSPGMVLKEIISQLLTLDGSAVDERVEAFLGTFAQFAIPAVNLGIFSSKDKATRDQQVASYTQALNAVIHGKNSNIRQKAANGH